MVAAGRVRLPDLDHRVWQDLPAPSNTRPVSAMRSPAVPGETSMPTRRQGSVVDMRANGVPWRPACESVDHTSFLHRRRVAPAEHDVELVAERVMIDRGVGVEARHHAVARRTGTALAIGSISASGSPGHPLA